MNETELLNAVKEIRTWVRAATYTSIKSLLEATLPDGKSRSAYQALDGTSALDQVRVASKVSPNTLVAWTQRWVAMGLMEVTDDNRRKRLFDLQDFAMLSVKEDETAREPKKKKR